MRWRGGGGRGVWSHGDMIRRFARAGDSATAGVHGGRSTARGPSLHDLPGPPPPAHLPGNSDIEENRTSVLPRCSAAPSFCETAESDTRAAYFVDDHGRRPGLRHRCELLAEPLAIRPAAPYRTTRQTVYQQQVQQVEPVECGDGVGNPSERMRSGRFRTARHRRVGHLYWPLRSWLARYWSQRRRGFGHCDRSGQCDLHSAHPRQRRIRAWRVDQRG